MKTTQERAERHDRERRAASERHRRKLEQMAEPQKEKQLVEHVRDIETDET